MDEPVPSRHRAARRRGLTSPETVTAPPRPQRPPRQPQTPMPGPGQAAGHVSGRKTTPRKQSRSLPVSQCAQAPPQNYSGGSRLRGARAPGFLSLTPGAGLSRGRRSTVRTRFVHGFVHGMYRDGVRRGRRREPKGNFTPQACQGQRAHQRPPETAETVVVLLITQRSRVQIPPPLPGETASGSWIPRPFTATCDQTLGRTGRPIAGRLVRRRLNRCTKVRARPTRARTHAGISVPGGAIARRGHGQRPCAEHAQISLPTVCSGTMNSQLAGLSAVRSARDPAISRARSIDFDG